MSFDKFRLSVGTRKAAQTDYGREMKQNVLSALLQTARSIYHDPRQTTGTPLRLESHKKLLSAPFDCAFS